MPARQSPAPHNAPRSGPVFPNPYGPDPLQGAEEFRPAPLASLVVWFFNRESRKTRASRVSFDEHMDGLA